MKNLLDILPLYGVEHNAILSKMGDVSVGYKVQLPELFTLSNNDYEAFHHSWIKAIKVMPAYSVLQKQDWFTKARHKAHFINEDTSFLTRSSERFFNERPYLDHQCYMLLTKKPANRQVSTSAFSSLLRRTIVPRETLVPKHFQDFLNHVGQFEKILCDSAFVSMKRLNNTELAELVLQYINLKTDDNTTRDIEFGNEWKIGENYCQLYTMADAEFVPALCGSRINYDKYSTDKTKFSVGFASPVGQLLSCNHIYSQYVFIGDVQKTMQRLESKRLRLQSLSAYSRENSIAKDATDSFLNEAISEQRLPVKAHFNVLAWTDTKDELRHIRNLCASALTQMDATPKIETEGSAQIYWAGIPGNAADFPMNDTFDTFSPQACCFFNLETNYISSTSPIGLRLGDRLTGRPIHVDISDEPMEKGICTNRNKFILGPSGSGKSFFTNHMVRSYYEQGTHIVLVDVGHSYKGLCDVVKGYYFTFSEIEPIKFNPFYIGAGDVLDTEKKESIKTLLMALWKKDNEAYNRSEYVALSNALQLYFEKLDKNKKVFPCFDSFYEFLKEDFVTILKGDNVKGERL